MSVKLLNVRVETVPDECPDASYLYQEGLCFEERREAYGRGEFDFIGVRAVAELNINGILQAIESPGIWGVESDSGDEYIAERGRDELDVLREMLADLTSSGVAA